MITQTIAPTKRKKKRPDIGGYIIEGHMHEQEMKVFQPNAKNCFNREKLLIQSVSAENTDNQKSIENILRVHIQKYFRNKKKKENYWDT